MDCLHLPKTPAQVFGQELLSRAITHHIPLRGCRNTWNSVEEDLHYIIAPWWRDENRGYLGCLVRSELCG